MKKEVIFSCYVFPILIFLAINSTQLSPLEVFINKTAPVYLFLLSLRSLRSKNGHISFKKKKCNQKYQDKSAGWFPPSRRTRGRGWWGLSKLNKGPREKQHLITFPPPSTPSPSIHIQFSSPLAARPHKQVPPPKHDEPTNLLRPAEGDVPASCVGGEGGGIWLHSVTERLDEKHEEPKWRPCLRNRRVQSETSGTAELKGHEVTKIIQ